MALTLLTKSEAGMKLTPPGAWPSWARGLLAGSLAVAIFIAILVAKYRALRFFVDHRVGGILVALGAFALVVLFVRRVLRVRGLALASTSVPLLLLLIVDLVVTPLPYEIAHAAATLPHPEGGAFPPAVSTAQFFDANHPVASVDFAYPPGTNVTKLEKDAISALERGGWMVEGITFPGGGMGSIGSFALVRGAFHGYCTFGDRQGPLMSCSLTV